MAVPAPEAALALLKSEVDAAAHALLQSVASSLTASTKSSLIEILDPTPAADRRAAARAGRDLWKQEGPLRDAVDCILDPSTSPLLIDAFLRLVRRIEVHVGADKSAAAVADASKSSEITVPNGSASDHNQRSTAAAASGMQSSASAEPRAIAAPWLAGEAGGAPRAPVSPPCLNSKLEVEVEASARLFASNYSTVRERVPSRSAALVTGASTGRMRIDLELGSDRDQQDAPPAPEHEQEEVHKQRRTRKTAGGGGSSSGGPSTSTPSRDAGPAAGGPRPKRRAAAAATAATASRIDRLVASESDEENVQEEEEDAAPEESLKEEEDDIDAAAPGPAAEADPERFTRKTIQAVLGGGSQSSWVHPSQAQVETRRLGADVDIGGWYLVLNAKWNPDCPLAPGQEGYAYQTPDAAARYEVEEIVRQSQGHPEFGGVLVAVSSGGKLYQLTGYYTASKTEVPLETFKELQPVMFEDLIKAIVSTNSVSGWFWGYERKRVDLTKPDKHSYQHLLPQQKADERKWRRRRLFARRLRGGEEMPGSGSDPEAEGDEAEDEADAALVKGTLKFKGDLLSHLRAINEDPAKAGRLREWVEGQLRGESWQRVHLRPTQGDRGRELRELVESIVSVLEEEQRGEGSAASKGKKAQRTKKRARSGA